MISVYLAANGSIVIWVLIGKLLLPYLLNTILLYRTNSSSLRVGWTVLDSTVEPIGVTSSELKVWDLCLQDIWRGQRAGKLHTSCTRRTRIRQRSSAVLVLTVHLSWWFSNPGLTMVSFSTPGTPLMFLIASQAGRSSRHFNFPQLGSTADLYRVHSKLKEQFSSSRRAVIAEDKGELFEFARKAEEVHQWSRSNWGL